MGLFKISLVLLIIIGLLLAIYGLHKKYQLLLFFGMIACLSPVFYFFGWTFLLPFVGPVGLIVSYLGKKAKSV